MKRKLIYSFFILLFCSCNSLNSKNNEVQDDHKKSQLDLISKYLLQFPHNSQLSIAIVTHNDVDFVGARNSNGEISLIDNKDSVFEIGSITKVFTSTILSRLSIDSVIQLDASIEGILPFKLNQISKNNSPITYKTLANHTSGLDFEPGNLNLSSDLNPNNPYQAYDYSLFNDYLQNNMVIDHTPGTIYQYSNLGYGLLGYLEEIHSGSDYESLLQEMVCEKYNLQNTSTEFSLVKNLTVIGLDTSGSALPHWDCNALTASGGVLSNADDLSKFILANFKDDPVLDLQRQITFNNMNNHTALGWEMFDIGSGRCSLNWYYKDGGMGGYSSVILMDIQNQLGVVVLSNISLHHKKANIVQLGFELLKDHYMGTNEKEDKCEAPFLEMALKKGWGTWNKSVNDSILAIASKTNPLVGIWQKPSNARSHLGINYETRTFLPDRKVQSDFMGNPEIDVWGYYDTKGNQIDFEDVGGNACKDNGLYQYTIVNDTLTFKLINDPCDGRLNGLSGTWTRRK